ncbi:hypothetical protein CRYUN_Cryun40dG0065400 [Craigia yunnanensis]
MEEKVTIMVLNVDLQCSRCYKKVKKVLCKFPQIRDQKYDEKANTVTITVGPCYFGGPPPLPRPCYETCGRQVYDSCGCGGGYGNKYYNVSRGDCLCEENPRACTIM